MLKKVFLFVFLFVFLLFLGINSVYAYGYRETNDNTNYKLIVEDDSNIYTMDNVSTLKNRMKNLTEYGNIILRTESNIGEDPLEYARKIYHNNFQDANGTIVLYLVSNNSFYVFSSGNNSNILTQEKVEGIIKTSESTNLDNKVFHATENIITKIGILLSGKEPVSYLQENNNSSYKIVIEDDAGLLSEEEVKKLSEKMTPLTEYGNIIFKSISINDTSESAYARDYYHNNFGTSSGTMFLIDMDNRKIYIFSDGDNYNVITSNKAYIITDNIYKYASNENYYECAAEAFTEINTLLNGGKIMEPMRHISNFFISLICAFLLCFIIVVSQTRIKKAKTNSILRNCDIDVSISNIIGRKTGVDREYSPVESSSGGSGFSGGGGGSSGGGGGGGSSGGGGGHSF